MEIKRNEATRNRPEGERVLDATYVLTDINSYLDQVHREESYSKNGKNAITVFKSGAFTQVLTAMMEGEEIIDNTVDGFVTVILLKGTALFKCNEGETRLEEGQMITIHPNVSHSLKALSEADLLLCTIPG
jgi:quercetin dioxygenase-like cupin family protein